MTVETATAPAIVARRLDVGYPVRGGTLRVLENLDLEVASGEFLTIVGPSGCGKSTLLRVLADLIPPLSGTVQVLGATPAVVRERRDVAFVFQDATLLPWRTVRENIALPLQVGRRSAARALAADVDALLELMGLAGLDGRYPSQLSGGQRQRVAIARALLAQPRILLMDEPFGALDEITRDRLNDELLALWERTGTTILFVTHSIIESVYLGQRVLVLAANPGRVRELVDLRAVKGTNGRCTREAPAAVEAMAHVRALLEGS